MNIVPPRTNWLSDTLKSVCKATVALLASLLATLAVAQTSTVVTNPAIGVFTGGVNLTARITSASVSGVVVSASRLSGTFPTSGVMRLCRGAGNVCEIVVQATYAAGTTVVTFPSFTPRAIRQDQYYVQRVDALATTTGGLDPNTRSGSMIVIADTVQAGRENVAKVSSGARQNCAITTVGLVKCWSRDATIPQAIGGLPAPAADVAVGKGHACALVVGEVYCWGDNPLGELGNGSTVSSVTPVRVSGITGRVTSIFAGNYKSCAIAGTTAWCWGGNNYGESTGGASPASPVAVTTAFQLTALSASVAQMSLGFFSACALKTDRTVSCWGENSTGQIGTNAGLGTTSPMPSTTVAGVAATALGGPSHGSHTCALRDDASVWCWGENGEGQLGRGFKSPYEWQPAKASGLTQTAVSIHVGGYSTCALLAGDAPVCWGSNRAGQLGIGVTVDLRLSVDAAPTLAATPPVGLSGIVFTQSVSESFQCLTLSDGAVRCSGNAGGLGNGSTNPSSVPVAVVGLGPARGVLPAPAITSMSRIGETINIVYSDLLSAGQTPIVAHQWGCKANNSTWTGTGGQAQTNEATGGTHVIQGALNQAGPWQCQVRFMTADTASAWSAWFTLPARTLPAPTVTSAIYDGAYGTVTWRDNLTVTDGPIYNSAVSCTVSYLDPPSANCLPSSQSCYAQSSDVEKVGSSHVNRLELPPANRYNFGSCKITYSNPDGGQVSPEIPLVSAPAPAPTITGGRVVGTQAVLTFVDNRATGQGIIVSANYTCTRTRDGGVASSGVVVNEPVNTLHTITVPLIGNNLLQDPDTYSCKVRVTPSVGTVSGDSPAFTIGPNSPPVVSNFTFTANNGVITGSFDINDPEGDQVKNVIAYFGSSPRSMECSSGTLGASWDVPRGGGRVQFNASLTNVGCGALTGSATTIYGFVSAQDVNGLYANIVQAQSSNTPPPPISVTPTTSYSIVFDAVPTTLAVKQAVDITMRIVDQNGVTATQFNGPVKLALSISGIGFSVEDPSNPAAVTSAHRVVWLQNGVGRLRAFRIHDAGVVRITAAASSNGSYQLNPILAVQPQVAMSSSDGSLKSGVVAAAAGNPHEYRGASTAIKVSVVAGQQVSVQFKIPQTTDVIGTPFFSDWRNGVTKAYFISTDEPTLPPYGGVTPDANGSTFTISAPIGSYRLVFVKSSVALSVRNERHVYTGTGVKLVQDVWAGNLPVSGAARRVLLVHGVFGSALQVTEDTEFVNKCAFAAASTRWSVIMDSFDDIASMPPQKCIRRDAQERALGQWSAENASCGQVSFLCEANLWGVLKSALTTKGYEVVPVAYDWRLTPDDAQREYLANVIEREVIASGQPVDIVAHSMGGLVALTFLSSLANDSRLSGYVDRLVLLGTPVAGSLNAYGLMDVADPMGLEGVSITKQGMYSSVAKYLWNSSSQFRRGQFVSCTRHHWEGVNRVCDAEDYGMNNTRRDRQIAFTEQAPSGWFLYPNRAHLPFVGTPSNAVSRIPDDAKAYFKNVDSPNSLTPAAGFAECNTSVAASTSVTNGRKTRVSLLLSNSENTLSSVESRYGDIGKAQLWKDVRLYYDAKKGDGTVPVRGQLEALASFLGSSSAILQSKNCAVVDPYRDHAGLTANENVHKWVKTRIPYPGTPGVLAAGSEPQQKVASAVTPQLSVVLEGTPDIVVNDIALGDIGRDSLGLVASSAVSGAASASSTMLGNAVKVTIINPTVGQTAIRLVGIQAQGVILARLAADYIDSTPNYAKRVVTTLIRPSETLLFSLSLLSSATSLPIQTNGVSAPTNLNAFPSASGTRLTWLAPPASTVPIAGYRVYASPSQDDGWTLIGSVGVGVTSYFAPYPAASNVQREVSFVVVAADAQDRYSEVLDFANNRVRDDVEGSFGTGRGNPGTLVLSPIVPMPNNVPISASVTGGEASVNGGAWLSTGLLIPPFANVQVRGVASSTTSQWTTVTLNGPTSASSFSILAAPPIFCRRPTRPVVESGAFIRYLDGISGTPLMQGLYPAAEVSPTAASTLVTHYSDNLDAYDFNGDGLSSVDIDGLLYARYALGFRGATLVSGIAVGTARTTTQIQAALAACQ